MIKSLFDKNLILIILFCFLAPIFFLNLGNVIILVIDKLMGYSPDKITYYGIVGCYTNNWMIPVFFFVSTIIYLVIIVVAFFVSKKASEKNYTHLMLLGAFLFYPAANRIINKIINAFTTNPLFFIEQKTYLEKQQVSFFGNLFNYDWVQFIFGNLLIFLYLILAYQIIFNHWNKKLRLQFFTFGLVSCFVGKIFWNLILGPAIY
jgi:hypothetical protein